MTLSLALANAVTGLRANTAQTELISNNVSNALTPGYSRKDIVLSPSAPGGQGSGVRIEATVRAVAPGVTEARRLSAADAGDGKARADALSRLAAAAGEPGEQFALATAADAFDAALAASADTPESAPLLNAAVASATNYVSAVTRVAAEAMALRTEADASIAKQVNVVNDTLGKVLSLNMEIKARQVSGGDSTALEDERARLIERITSMIPIKVVPREFGEVAIFAKNGAQLLDGNVFELEFTPTPLVTPDRTLANGGVSGISINGFAIRIGEGGNAGLLDGGSLSATFELRDSILPRVGATIDGIASDLIARTQGLAADPTLAPGAAGLFTDGGATFDPANLTGLALRLQVNPAVDPDLGGEPFRLRDGIGAAAPGEVGEDSLLRGLQDAMRELRAPPAGTDLTTQRDAAGFTAEFSALILTRASVSDSELAFRQGRTDGLAEAELTRIGVETDQELARLLVVEQAFAANARVVQVVDELLERLTNL